MEHPQFRTDFNEIQWLFIFLKSIEGILVGFLALEDGTDRFLPKHRYGITTSRIYVL